ncbi:C-factor-like [Hippoglossus hippoglossus]|uniref:C-factor-like n=1 Tax=Hippoglossus hippoglossus TaxID=8267 RepID=UPI00148E050C|nr:C-factor-like [Hippoglossus hippoglossus]
MSGAMRFGQCGSVLVTGASRGIGLQMVDSLAGGGFSPGKIIATTRNPDGAQNLQDLALKHPNIHIIPLDVLSQESIDKCAEEVSRLVQDEGLNCLINNAGINLMTDFHTVTADKMIENFRTNAVAPLMITKAFLPLLKAAASRGGAGGSGSMSIQRAAVINISSQLGSVELNWGESANIKWFPYRTSKCALNMVSRCMATDLEPDGILCLAIHPGWVHTDMGGPQAPLSPEESTSSMLSVFGGLSEKAHGLFLSFTGEVLPW